MTYDAEILVRVEDLRAAAVSANLDYIAQLSGLVPEEADHFNSYWAPAQFEINKMAQRATATLEARPR